MQIRAVFTDCKPPTRDKVKRIFKLRRTLKSSTSYTIIYYRQQTSILCNQEYTVRRCWFRTRKATGENFLLSWLSRRFPQEENQAGLERQIETLIQSDGANGKSGVVALRLIKQNLIQTHAKIDKVRVVHAWIVITDRLTLRRLMTFKLLERKRKIRAQSQQAKLYVYRIEIDNNPTFHASSKSNEQCFYISTRLTQKNSAKN